MPQHPILLLLVAALLAGCGDRTEDTAKAAPEAEVTAPAPAPDPATSAPPEVAPVEPADIAVNSGTGVSPTGPSWGAFLETLPPDQRHELTAFNARHFGALAFQNEAEREKLAALGFPTPEDVLEAARLTDSELKARGDAGDVQAQMLLVDRWLAQAEAARANKETDPQGYENAAMRAMSAASMLIPRTKSPFGAYLDGRANWQLSSDMSPETMAASMMVASDLGDWRAKAFLREFQRQNPGMDAAATVEAYSILRRTWRVR